MREIEMNVTLKKKAQFFNIWSTYALFYFGKVNLAIIVPILLKAYTDLSLVNIGLVSSGFFFAYAIGQFLHGQLSEKFNPYVYIIAGLLLSGITNVFLSFAGSIYILLLVGEIFDGFFQSMGWSSCVRANANLFKNKISRDKYSVLLGTSYQVGNSLAWLITAAVVGKFGWRAGFFVAGTVLILRGVILYLTQPRNILVRYQDIKTQVKNTFALPIIISGFCLCLLNMVRYGIITWIPLYLFTKHNLEISQIGKVGMTVCLIPLAGVIGTLLFNWIKFTHNTLTTIYLAGLCGSLLMLPFVTGIAEVGFLILSGLFLYGPHVYFVTVVPSNYLQTRTVAASTGFIDGMGYVGTILVGILIPILVTYFSGWNSVFYFWALLTIIVAIFAKFGLNKI